MTQKQPYLFILATYNDIDHQTPVIWKMAKRGHAVRVVFADRDSNTDIQGNTNIQYLKKEAGVEVFYYYSLKEWGFRLPNRCLVRAHNPIALKCSRWMIGALKRWVWNDRWAEQVLRKINPVVCMGDIHALEKSTIEGKLIGAARKLGIPVVALTHGPDVYAIFDAQSHGLARPVRGNSSYEDPRYKAYDYIVATTPFEARQWREKGGFDESRLGVLGLPRYSQDWMSIQSSLQPPYKSEKDPGNRLKVLFFMPHWREHVHRDKTIAGIEAIAALDFVHLVVKEHTREGAGNLPLNVKKRLEARPNAEVISSSPTISFKDWAKNGFRAKQGFKSADSAALVRWADVVICFASSVGIEVICQKKPLINPVYMYTYATAYDALGANILAGDQKELLGALESLKANPKRVPYDDNLFCRTVVFADKPAHDILQSYTDFIVSRGKTNE